jgi:hypothetical protein
MVTAEAVKQEAWDEWIVHTVKCTSCSRERLTLDHGYFHQVLVSAMLTYVENTATNSAHNALTNLSLLDFSEQGDGLYIDPASFDDEVQLRIDTSDL